MNHDFISPQINESRNIKVRPAGAATDELHETIREQIKAMNKSSVVITRLTYVMVFIGVVQIVVAIAPLSDSIKRIYGLLK
jgi:hypothetical protein